MFRYGLCLCLGAVGFYREHSTGWRASLITLVAVLCHQLAGVPHPVCVDEVVPVTSTMMAGKASDPVEVPFTWVACQINGEMIIADWIRNNPIYRTWKLATWKCVPGKYEPTLFFRKFIKDRREAFIREATEWWLNNPGEFEKEKATIRGRVLEMFELEDVAFDAIELFYNERKDGAEIS